jgi:Zinc knuckle
VAKPRRKEKEEHVHTKKTARNEKRLPDRWSRNQFERRPMRTDRDGDIVMTGAKVSAEEARKGNLCFNCGKKGHFAENCRNRRESGRPTKRDMKPRMETLKMVRRTPEEESIEETDLENQEREQVDVSSIFQKLSLEDFDTSDSDEMLATEKVDLEVPNRKSLGTDGHEEKETFSIPGEQTDGLVCHSGIQMDTTALRVNRKRGGNSTTVRKFTERLEEPSRTLEERLATVNFSKMTETREPYNWKEYCNRREIITEKYEE